MRWKNCHVPASHTDLCFDFIFLYTIFFPSLILIFPLCKCKCGKSAKHNEIVVAHHDHAITLNVKKQKRRAENKQQQQLPRGATASSEMIRACVCGAVHRKIKIRLSSKCCGTNYTNTSCRPLYEMHVLSDKENEEANEEKPVQTHI